jgi:acyl-CoA synthetase (AMP-forming)/AMP-acid ligase II
MIISGGENVYPAEVENAIHGHPDVFDVAVIGVPSEKWGEEVKAIVQPKPGSRLDPQDVIRWARERVAVFKTPKRRVHRCLSAHRYRENTTTRAEREILARTGPEGKLNCRFN